MGDKNTLKKYCEHQSHYPWYKPYCNFIFYPVNIYVPYDFANFCNLSLGNAVHILLNDPPFPTFVS